MIQNKIRFLKEEFPPLLEQLKVDDQAKWGVMTAHHMVEHLGLVIKVSYGKIKAVPQYEADSQARKKGRFMGKAVPFPRNLKLDAIPEKAAPLRTATIEEAKQNLRDTLAAFYEHYQQNPDSEAHHPVLGDMNYAEWLEFHARHIEHHFIQFGLLEDIPTSM